MPRLYTIGYSGKSAEAFFGLLEAHGVACVVDVRLRADSQLNGFAKARDLPYFLRHLIDCDYRRELRMAPTDALLDGYRKSKSWETYERDFRALLDERQLAAELDRSWWTTGAACLLCSEHEPDRCHRRVVAEYLVSHWPELTVEHLI